MGDGHEYKGIDVRLGAIQLAANQVEAQRRWEQLANPGVWSAWASDSLLGRLRAFSGSSADLDGMVELAAYGRALAAEYEAQGVPTPDWLAGKLVLLAEEIKAAHRAQRLARLREVEREVEELKSKEEKRKDRQAEADRLRRELGLGER